MEKMESTSRSTEEDKEICTVKDELKEDEILKTFEIDENNAPDFVSIGISENMKCIGTTVSSSTLESNQTKTLVESVIHRENEPEKKKSGKLIGCTYET